MSLDREPNTRLRQLRLTPLCILCAVNTEAHAIARGLGIEDTRWSGEDIDDVDDRHVFYHGELTMQSGETLKYYVTSGLRMAIQSFAVHAALLFHILKPRYALHVGSCAGFREKRVDIGDVILGEVAINYEEGKLEVTDRGLVLIPDYNRVGIESGDLKTFAERFTKSSKAEHEQQTIKASVCAEESGQAVQSQAELAAHQPGAVACRFGEYISGSSLRKDAQGILHRVHDSNARNVIALDMEASAFLQLCEHFSSVRGPSCIGVVKGVSDYGDTSRDGADKEAAWQMAMANTAHVVKHWILFRLPKITWINNEDEEPGAHIALGYGENFIKKVGENFYNHLPITATDNHQVIPREDIKGLKVILPNDRDPRHLRDLSVVQPTIDRYGIREVAVGIAARRTLHYKAGYFIDWARCLNGLDKYPDYLYQVDVFVRQIQKGSYFKGVGSNPPFAQVVDWSIDAIPWLDEVLKAEKEQRTMSNQLGVADKPNQPADGDSESGQASLPLRC